MDALPGDLPPTRIGRQPSCRYCEHEEHVFSRCLLSIDDALCPCPPHRPVGVYEVNAPASSARSEGLT